MKIPYFLKQTIYTLFRADEYVHTKMQQVCCKNKLTVGEKKLISTYSSDFLYNDIKQKCLLNIS